MPKFFSLKFLLTLTAIVELFYVLTTALPPSILELVTGWSLSPDGHWIVKILCAALLVQAYTAWTFRNDPPVGIVKILAFYQLASATIDWVLWLALRDQGIFSTTLAQTGIVLAVISHYALGFCLLAAIRAMKKE